MEVSTKILMGSVIVMALCFVLVFIVVQQSGEEQMDIQPPLKENIGAPANHFYQEQGQELKKNSEEIQGTSLNLTQFYTGFKSLNPGDYAIWKMPSGTQKVVYLGTQKEDNQTYELVELTTETNTLAFVVKLWVNRNTKQGVKAVMKIGNLTYCVSQMPVEETSSVQYLSTPEEYEPENIAKNYKYSLVDFTTETGKMVKAVKIEQNSTEIWVSSEVPFGMVKIIENGTVYLELKDFGTNNTFVITEEDVVGCIPLSVNQTGF